MSDSDDLEVAKDPRNQADGSREQVTIEDGFPPFPVDVYLVSAGGGGCEEADRVFISTLQFENCDFIGRLFVYGFIFSVSIQPKTPLWPTKSW